MSSTEVIDDALEIVDGWLQGKSSDKFLTSTDILAEEATLHANTTGLGYTGTKQQEQNKKVLSREEEMLRKKIVTAQRKARSFKNKMRKGGEKQEEEKEEEDRLYMTTNADKYLEISRTAIGSKKTNRAVDITEAGGSSSSSSSRVAALQGPAASSQIALDDTDLDGTDLDNIDGKTNFTSSSASTNTSTNSRPICMKYSTVGQCKFGSGCRYSHDCEPGHKDGNGQEEKDFGDGGFGSSGGRQRKRKKTRSKQKNIRRDTRPLEAKPHDKRPLTAETKKRLGMNDDKDDYGVDRPFSDANPNPKKMKMKMMDGGISSGISSSSSSSSIVKDNKKARKRKEDEAEDLGFYIDRG